MRGGISGKLFAWLMLVTLPAAGAAAVALYVIDIRLSERIESTATNTTLDKASSLHEVLDGYRRDASGLAAAVRLRRLMGRHARADTPYAAEFSLKGLAVLAADVERQAIESDSGIVAVSIVAPDGSSLGRSGEVQWHGPGKPLLDKVLRSGLTHVGEAFPTDSGTRLGLVAPVLGARGSALGALLLEARLEPLIRHLDGYRRLGLTSEAYLVQHRVDGSGEWQLISPLRFRAEAAFQSSGEMAATAVVADTLGATQASPRTAVDYRGIEAVFATASIADTNWTLVTKIDHDEAYAPVDEVGRLVKGAIAVTFVALLFGWVVYLHPLSRRLRHVASAASQVASGSHRRPLGDRNGDEIGEIARAIDRLASDLEEDIRLRNVAEEKLRHQATHDPLTGLANRQHASERIAALDANRDDMPVSVLFLDLDGFKPINDTHGHAVGDEVLGKVGLRVCEAIPKRVNSIVARWGGDEFVVILRDVAATEAHDIARRVREAFDSPFQTLAAEQQIGCSIGLECAVAGESVSEALVVADARMYEDKAARRAWRAGDLALRRAV